MHHIFTSAFVILPRFAVQNIFVTIMTGYCFQHPEICAFPAEEFYDNKLLTRVSDLWDGYVLSFWPHYQPDSQDHVPHLLVDVRGEEETLTVTTDQGNERSKSNSLEADKVVR